MNDPTATLTSLPPPPGVPFRLGTSRRPDGRELSADNRSLLLDGHPWMPAMGEFHYARYPADEWREELLKMKAAGIGIVASYVFWIHHEETPDAWDWSGCRDLRRFVATAAEAGLLVVVRGGPWCHGEVRNGGLPDWIVQRDGSRTRTTDPQFLAATRHLYEEIAREISGLLWKDGGPVIAFQVDNEYTGDGDYLLALKRLALEVGIDVPLFTRTGWPRLKSPVPHGELLPLYGGYAEGFWDRSIEPMPGHAWTAFVFSHRRIDTNIANDQLGQREAGDEEDAGQYPYLTCEIGGGMADSYHRRVLTTPADIEAIVMQKLGSGSTLPGYYVFHGGTNPEGIQSTLQESQATGYFNDLPVKTYDFQAALGEYGQVRPHYHLLRRLHLFLGDFGSKLATMPALLPDAPPGPPHDTRQLRWAARTDGHRGFVFVNNYQRLLSMPAKPDVRFTLCLPGGRITFPAQPVTLPADTTFFWPFRLDLGGVELLHATARPLCQVDDDGVRTAFFAETPGVPAEFAFGWNVTVRSARATVSRGAERTLVSQVQPSRCVAMELTNLPGLRLCLVLLNEADSLALWKLPWLGRDRVFLTRSALVVDGKSLRLTTPAGESPELGVLPAPSGMACGGLTLETTGDGAFSSFVLPPPPTPCNLARVRAEPVREAGPLRQIRPGPIADPMAQAPEEADFAAAAAWRIHLPVDLDFAADPILRIAYVGDVARLLLDGRLLADDYYNGRPLEFGLRRHGRAVLSGELVLEILPLQRNAPIYLAGAARPDFGDAPAIAAVISIDLAQSHTITLTPNQTSADAGGRSQP